MLKNLKDKYLSNKVFYTLLIIAIFLGILLRGIVYFQQYSFERDEADLILGLLSNSSFYELFVPKLSIVTVAPCGFIIISKLLIAMLGTSELVVRLIPFACGVSSIFLFYLFVKKYLSNYATIFAMLLFALSPKLIMYSAFFKQYSVDVFVALLLLALTDSIFERKNISFVSSVITGIISICFSLPSAFILGAIGFYNIGKFLFKKQYKNFYKTIIISFIWLFAFIAQITLIKYFSSDIVNHLTNAWDGNNAFMPIPPDLIWFFKQIITIPINIYITNEISALILGFLFVFGFLSFIFKEKAKSLILILPVLLTLIASALHLYPFSDRQILFLFPIFILFIAKNLDIIEKFSFKPTIKGVLSAMFSVFILIQIPFGNKYFLNFRTYNKMDDIYEFMQENMKEDDLIYLRVVDASAFKVYERNYNFSGRKIEGITESDGLNYNCYSPMTNNMILFKKDIAKLKASGGRVWVPFYSDYFQNEIRVFKENLSKEAKMISSKVTLHGEVYLFKF